MALANITLTFGLISFAAKLDKATETPVEMKNLCIGSNGQPAHDPKPLTAPRKCAECGEITDYSGVVKGIKSGTTYAITTQDEVAEAKLQNVAQYKGKVAMVPHPVADFEAHTAPGKSLYYVTPDPAAADHYRLIVQLVKSHPELAFVSLYTPRSAAGLYQVKVRDDVLVLEERTRGQAMKVAPVVGGTSNAQLYQMLEGVLATFVQPYDPDAYEDTYAAAIAKLADAATDTVHLGSAGASKAEPAAKASSDEDLMAKLAALATSSAA